jgi:hypothetical protein
MRGHEHGQVVEKDRVLADDEHAVHTVTFRMTRTAGVPFRVRLMIHS